ncbi:hypothetical protein CEXT_206631 [Caerostris extrusa]|uniref:Uncharacterized protein n=1 Tax=Caerostris extrusa TaxID=172846 RepID=A0AAV4MTH9_CAEEX|nr:hypothetical protein CEXT_206631 [Caerostris extrusa]
MGLNTRMAGWLAWSHSFWVREPQLYDWLGMFSPISTESEEIHPFEMDHIPESMLRKCEVELTETPEKKLKAIQEVREILRGTLCCL